MALSAAKALGAQVEALFIAQPPPPRGGVSAGEIGYTGRMATALQVNWYAEERDRLAREARERFAHACAANSIPILAANEEPGTLPAASGEVGSESEAARDRAPSSDRHRAFAGKGP